MLSPYNKYLQAVSSIDEEKNNSLAGALHEYMTAMLTPKIFFWVRIKAQKRYQSEVTRINSQAVEAKAVAWEEYEFDSRKGNQGDFDD